MSFSIVQTMKEDHEHIRQLHELILTGNKIMRELAEKCPDSALKEQQQKWYLQAVRVIGEPLNPS